MWALLSCVGRVDSVHHSFSAAQNTRKSCSERMHVGMHTWLLLAMVVLEHTRIAAQFLVVEELRPMYAAHTLNWAVDHNHVGLQWYLVAST